MTVSSTSNVGASQPTAPVPANPKGDLNEEAFMKLLVAELKQQDPMDPMQARDMVAQLATLTSVQKLTTIDSQLSRLNDGSVASASMQSANLIGRTITADKSRLQLNGIGLPTGGYTLPSAADSVSINVLNSEGKVVRTLDMGAQKAGQQTFQWDGRSDGNTRLSNGAYTFQVAAKNAAGTAVPVSTQVSGLVSEVTFENGAAEVVVGGARVSLADVTQIAQ
jgi:flagellar basal-body rod modification protein FlgD